MYINFTKTGNNIALIAQLGERQTEDLKVHSSILCQGTFFAFFALFNPFFALFIIPIVFPFLFFLFYHCYH